MKPLIVQKYGGATLADPQKIKAVASRIKEQTDSHAVVVVVSAMGKTTNSLIDLANQISLHPQRREMDMLLTVGERISMSLVSMALNEINCPAISYTGSQAGILTDDSHVNAFIKDVKAFRVEDSIKQGKVVVLAGFQGVSPTTKEITTLGRGGSDTSAVAMAAYFKADRCEILKDVPAVFTADPNIAKQARPLNQLNYDQLMEMTFWGAKVLHYRSVELAKQKRVPLYIGPAARKTQEGTVVEEGINMFESCRALSINSHETVLKISSSERQASKALLSFQKMLSDAQIPFPQLLSSTSYSDYCEFVLTGPQEILKAIETEFKANSTFKIQEPRLATVTLTCTGATSPEISQEFMSALDKARIPTLGIYVSAMSVTAIIDGSLRTKAIEHLHPMIKA